MAEKAELDLPRRPINFLLNILKNCSVAGETELEMAQRLVRQAEKHVSRKLEIIADTTLRNQPTGLAENFPFSFESILHAHKDHLGQLISE